MWFLIISILVAIVFGWIFLAIFESDNKRDKVLLWLRGFMVSSVGTFAALVLIGLVVSVGFEPVCEISHGAGEVISTQEITCLGNSTTMSGEFSLKSGYVNGHQVYSIFVKDGEDYTLLSLDADKTILRYINDGSTPRLETCEENEIYTLNDKPTFWMFEAVSWVRHRNKPLGTVVKVETTNNQRYILYVPEGTITEQFVVDLSK